jgi:inactivated superfamily I helicase
MQKNQSHKKPYKHFIANNPQTDRQYKNKDEEEEEKDVLNRMLYDENDDAKKKRQKDTISRMIKSYQKRKRKEKIDKLTNRDDHWKGLEDYNMNEDANGFSNQFRILYFSGKLLSFRQWCDKVEELLDKL